MKLSYLITVLIIYLSISSCLDYRGRVINRYAKKVKEGKLTREQYDSIISKFYTLKRENLSGKEGIINFRGAYVNKYLEYDTFNYHYSIIKLDTLANIYLSQKINFPPTNETIRNLYNSKMRYVILGNELLFESIQIRNMKTYNVINYAKISGDTLIFYKSMNLQNSKYDSYINPVRKYIYSDDLTENMKYPPEHLPVNNGNGR